MGLVAYYKFDETAGRTAKEERGLYHGTLSTDITIGHTGKFQKCFYFSSNARISISADTMPVANNPRSLSLWMKGTFLANKQTPIFQGGVQGVSAAFNITLNTSAANAKFFHVQKFTNDVQSNEFPLSDNEWHHLVVVYNGTTNWNIKFYVDNVEISNAHLAAEEALNTASAAQYIGKNAMGAFTNAAYFDDYRIYNHALSTTEIDALYHYFDNTVAVGSIGSSAINKNYPAVEGLIAGTTKLKDDYTLIPETDLTTENEKRGL